MSVPVELLPAPGVYPSCGEGWIRSRLCAMINQSISVPYIYSRHDAPFSPLHEYVRWKHGTQRVVIYVTPRASDSPLGRQSDALLGCPGQFLMDRQCPLGRRHCYPYTTQHGHPPKEHTEGHRYIKQNSRSHAMWAFSGHTCSSRACRPLFFHPTRTT